MKLQFNCNCNVDGCAVDGSLVINLLPVGGFVALQKGNIIVGSVSVSRQDMIKLRDSISEVMPEPTAEDLLMKFGGKFVKRIDEATNGTPLSSPA